MEDIKPKKKGDLNRFCYNKAYKTTRYGLGNDTAPFRNNLINPLPYTTAAIKKALGKPKINKNFRCRNTEAILKFFNYKALSIAIIRKFNIFLIRKITHLYNFFSYINRSGSLLIYKDFTYCYFHFKTFRASNLQKPPTVKVLKLTRGAL